MNLYEAVGLAKIGGLHYLLMAYSATGNLGDRHDQRHLGHRHGMYTFTAESPEGPFRPDTEAYPLLVSNPQPGLRPMTFCARFYPTPDETLAVHHHSVARSGLVWFSPLKKAVVDGGGHLRLGYWRGNDALKGAPIGIDLTCCSVGS